jgi:hypothetical protein
MPDEVSLNCASGSGLRIFSGSIPPNIANWQISPLPKKALP